MRTSIIFIAVLLASAVLSACKKETDIGSNTAFIKALECEDDIAAVGNILLSDNSVIVVCRTIDEMAEGYMYKINNKGDLVWKKRLYEKNKGCCQVYDLPGNGFVVLGYENYNTDQFMQVFVYDDDGNFVSSKYIPVDYYPWYTIQYYSSMQMFRLNNGNFVFAWNSVNMLLTFTNSTFDTLFTKSVPVSLSTQSFIRGIYQNTDSTILFANALYIPNSTYTQYDADIHITKTDLSGNIITNDSIYDNSHNETPNALLPIGNKMFLVTGRMGRFNESSGAVVNYLGNGLTQMISGDINLVQLSSEGGFISRQSIHDYPANGMIMNARPTSDGGLILCGTVNQSDQTNLISPTKIYLMKVNANGMFEWSKMAKTTYPSFGIDAVQTSEGGYLVTGYHRAADKRFEALVIKTDANGNF